MKQYISKGLILFTFLLGFTQFLSSQIVDPVTWHYSSKQIGPHEFALTFTAEIDPGWHLYSQLIEEGGPVPTSFYYEGKEGVEVSDTKAKEIGEVHRQHDETFDMEVAYFSNKVSFVKTVKTTAPKAKLSGYLEFMVCDDEKCLPPSSEDFSFELIDTFAEEPEEEQRQEPQLEEPQKEKKAKPEKQQIKKLPVPTNIEKPVEQTEEPQATLPPTSPFSGGGLGQGAGRIEDPVIWDYSAKKLAGDVYELQFKASIEQGWKLYSMLMEEGGPTPPEIILDSGAYEIVSELKEIAKVESSYDKEIFEMDVITIKDKALYTQQIKVLDPSIPITGELGFMACADVCIFPPASAFSISLEGKNTAVIASSEDADTGFMIGSLDLNNPISSCIEAIKQSDSLWVTFLLGLIGGFVALLTPCVFPMIPMTVTYFTKGGDNKKKGISQGVLYGLAIFLIYVLMSVPFHLFESVQSDILNSISTNPWLNFFFFVIFIVFALSFFGYFELALPHQITNKASSASDIGGILGIFFMALTLVLVSFSCTGPILGGLLGATTISPETGAMHLSAGMGGFGVGLGLPFALFAIFPGWLNSLPKSGGWMTTLKVILGFIELGLAIKFLSRADLVWQAGFLKREIFIGLWIIIGIAMIAYILGWIRFPHDGPSSKITSKQLAGAAIVLLFVGYLAPGLAKDEKYANLSLISGFPPPLHYSIYERENTCPLGMDCFKDYEEGMAYARKVNKPVMLDFTGHACENCRRMEENVWVDKDVFDRINGEYVLISLYVDDRTKLPESEQREIVMFNGSRRKIRTIGNKWSTFQTQNFQHNTQPYYVLMSPDEKLLNNPVAYTPAVEEYLNFLDCGLAAFEQTAEK